MLEKPNIPDELIVSRLQVEYNLHVAELTFLPIGLTKVLPYIAFWRMMERCTS